MQSQFISAINQICEEKNIPKEVVLDTVEAALAAAYKKDYGERDQEVRVKINEETGEIKAYITKTVVEEAENQFLEISLADAKKINKKAKLEETVEVEDTPTDFGRIAAQTAKQVIIQRIREAERDIVFSEYKDKEGELVNANVQRIEGSTVIVDLGQASGVLFSNEQVNGERYYISQRLKVYIVKVEQSTKGPQVVVSRSHPGVIKKLFEMEVPEIEAGLVIIKAIAREAGFRTKIAVSSAESNIDPVGSCVGQKGIRVQSVQGEVGQEKIDVIPWSEDQKEFITNALSPAKVIKIELNEEEKKAKVDVKEDQLSLAIGKSGQNVRLAAKLTGWGIDINVGEGGETKEKTDDTNDVNEDTKNESKEEIKVENVEQKENESKKKIDADLIEESEAEEVKTETAVESEKQSEEDTDTLPENKEDESSIEDIIESEEKIELEKEESKNEIDPSLETEPEKAKEEEEEEEEEETKEEEKDIKIQPTQEKEVRDTDIDSSNDTEENLSATIEDIPDETKISEEENINDTNKDEEKSEEELADEIIGEKEQENT